MLRATLRGTMVFLQWRVRFVFAVPREYVCSLLGLRRLENTVVHLVTCKCFFFFALSKAYLVNKGQGLESIEFGYV